MSSPRSSAIAIIVTTAIAAVVSLPDTVQARDAETQLTLCKSSSSSAVGHAEDLHENEHLHERDIAHKKSRVDQVQQDCIDSDVADEMAELSGYDEVEANYEQARELVESYRKETAKQQEEELSTAMAEGLGDDRRKRQKRWENRPKRCRDHENWNEAIGVEEDDEPQTAAITGGDDLFDGDEDEVSEHVFNGHRGLDADNLVVRHACGEGVEGIDGWFTSHDVDLGGQIREGDPRLNIADGLEDDEISDDRRILYQAVAAHLCWYASHWNLETGYGAFLHCRDIASDLPSSEKVQSAMKAEYPDFEFEHRNIQFLYDRALEAKDEVIGAFDRLEDEYPLQREVYYESGKKAQRQYEQRQDRYGAIIEMVDPITDDIFDDSTDQPPENCSRTAERARHKLIEKTGLDSPDDVDELRAEHPVGYQITEALAHCYLGEGQLAKAWVESLALREGTRRVTLGETIAVARRKALHEVEQQYAGSDDAIIERIPYYERRHNTSIPLPSSTYRTPNFLSRTRSAGMIQDVVGGPEPDDEDDDIDDLEEQRAEQQAQHQDFERGAPVIESLEDAGQGTKIVFVSKTETVTRQDHECHETDRFRAWELRGNEMIARYEIECEPVGEPYDEDVVHQEDPVVVPDDQAQWLEEGMRVEVLSNRHRDASDDDAVIRHAWPAGQSGADPVVVDGIAFD